MTERPRPHSKLERVLAVALVFATFLLLIFTQFEVGIPRDEAVYFEAGSRYAAWVDDWMSSPVGAISRESVSQRFEYNREHPALPKILFGLSHRFFVEYLGWFNHILGFRLPALGFSALLMGFTFLLGARIAGPLVGLFAALGMMLIPRHFFHFHLACFDIPVTAAWVMTVYFYLRSLEENALKRWAVFSGLAFGLGISIKHNIYFLPPLLVLHWLVVYGRDAWAMGTFKDRVKAIPLAFPCMAILGPLLLFVSWPFLWYDTVDRFAWYVQFHAKHVHYSWEYFGQVLDTPPFPIAYPFIVTALTVPVALLLPMCIGLLQNIYWELRRAFPQTRNVRILLLFNALFSLCLIALPNVPIFGGMKHWLPSMPFLLILGGLVVIQAATSWTSCTLEDSRSSRLAIAIGIAIMVPSGLLTARYHPYGTSAYNELAGLTPGAASLGMQRQYWSSSVTHVLPWLNENAPKDTKVYFHEVMRASFRWYKSEGLIRADIRWANDPASSDIVVYQYHREFRDHEFQAWTMLKTIRPVTGLYLDEVPQIIVYTRPVN